MCRITLAGIVPILCVETKEELHILHHSQSCEFVLHEQIRVAYPHGVCLGAIHVPKKEISKLDRIQTSKEQPKLNSVLVFEPSIPWYYLRWNMPTTRGFGDRKLGLA